jgi:hypothetical protein
MEKNRIGAIEKKKPLVKLHINSRLVVSSLFEIVVGVVVQSILA